ncbi:MAG: hypothetical protein JSS62_03200 [Verrucomicrobia bacterium]|nr:hypothetical protein [Verrucomicrobiota bacterium]MBS0646677.1 hypothetical protein [Verrucomicrobiota bacterium]
MQTSIALFGESQKGNFHTGYYCKNLTQLLDFVGEPPSLESQGLLYAVQSLLYQYHVIFFRVREEGFSVQDYLNGLQLLGQQRLPMKLSAICLPGVGNSKIIEATNPICLQHNSLIILTEQDLYDYLTN